MAEITLQKLGALGVVANMGNAANGDTAQVGGNKRLIVQNTDASSHAVTVAVPGNDFTGAAKPDLTVTVAASAIVIIPLLDAYADPALNGQAGISYAALTGMKRTVVAD